jgi:hypothetical protein
VSSGLEEKEKNFPKSLIKEDRSTFLSARGEEEEEGIL